MKFSRSSFLSIQQVALATGRAEWQVRRAIRRGVLPVVRRRGRVLVPVGVVSHMARFGIGGER
jgi:hypothetical protein